jgi:monovalent cation:H+ antiporter-2, CPA2 family
MPHETTLIATLVVSLALAFAGGFLASKLRLPPLVGYLLAGVAVGPFTPGFVGDEALASQLAEIGIILLMFGVGLHFSIKDLWAVRRIAVPGALGQTLPYRVRAMRRAPRRKVPRKRDLARASTRSRMHAPVLSI